MDLKAIWNWLVTSSSDPAKTSAALKGILMLAGGYILKALVLSCSLGILCLPVDQDLIDKVIFAVTGLVDALLIAIGFAVTLFGLARKFYNGRWSATQ